MKTFFLTLILLSHCASIYGFQLAPCAIEQELHNYIRDNSSRHQQNLGKYDSFRSQYGQVQKTLPQNPCPNGITIIPIAFNIFHEGEPEGVGYNFAVSELQLAVNRLNEDFSGYNARRSHITRVFHKTDAGHTCIQFTIGKINRMSRASCPTSHQGAMSFELSKCLPGGAGAGSDNDPHDYLNVYSHFMASGFLGNASCIPNLFGSCNTAADGVTIDREILIPRIGSTSPHSQGGVLSHEIGHWLGLPHVNGDIRGGGCEGDDGFDDTFPQEQLQHHTCRSLRIPNSCKTPDNVFNFMDYGHDCVKLMFTAQQAALMNAVLKHNRKKLSTSYKRGKADPVLDIFKKNTKSNTATPKFEFVNARCFVNLNLLEYMRKWYPVEGKPLVDAGLTLYYWTFSNGHIERKISGIDLAQYHISHRDRFQAENTILKLRRTRWDPISLRYLPEEEAGVILVSITDCGTPPNDSISGAIMIGKETCEQQQFYLSRATPSDMLHLDCKNDAFSKDVWFRTVVPSSGAIQLDAYRLEGEALPPRMQLFTGSKLTGNLMCLDARPHIHIQKYDLVPGDTLLIRVINANDELDKGVFTICVEDPPLKNEDCITPFILHVGKSCDIKEFHNYGALISNVPDYSFACGNGSIMPDIWFVARVPEEGRIGIETFAADGGVSGTVVEVFSGTCSNLNLLGCSGNKSYWPLYDDFSKIELFKLDPGQLVYIRVGGSGRVVEGHFGLCTYVPSSESNECKITAIVVGTSYECQGSTNTYDQELIVHYTAPYEGSVLYINDQYFDLTENPQIILLEDLLASGQRVDVIANLVNEEDPGCWQSSFYLAKNLFRAPEECSEIRPINDECEGAIFIYPSDDLYIDTFTNIGATWSSGHSEYFACGNSGYRPQDVWFKTIVPLTGGVDIGLPLLYNENNMILEVYEGTCGMLTLIDCDQFSRSWGSFSRIISQRPGDTLYIRVADLNSDTQDIFLLYISEYTPLNHTEAMTNLSHFTSHTASESSYSKASIRNTVTIGPNPVLTEFRITNHGETDISALIYNIEGRIIERVKLSAFDQKTIETSTWTSGMYFVKWADEHGSWSTEKIIVQQF